MQRIEIIVRDNLKRLRRERNLKQQDLAVSLGLKQQTIASMEAGRRSISLKHLDRLCKEFGLVPEYFFAANPDSNYANKLGLDLLSSLEDISRMNDNSRIELKNYIDYLVTRRKE